MRRSSSSAAFAAPNFGRATSIDKQGVNAANKKYQNRGFRYRQALKQVAELEKQGKDTDEVQF